MSGAATARRPVIGARGRTRIMLDGAEVVMLGSNDYLGLSTDPCVLEATIEALRRYGTGTGIYPVFATTPLHLALAERLAALLGVRRWRCSVRAARQTRPC